MNLTFKYRLYPTLAQDAFLSDQLASACALYNAALQERIGAWKISRTSVTYYDQSYQLKAIRAAGDLGIPNFGCGSDVLRRVDRTFKAFYRRVKRGATRVGFPRWRSARRYDSLTFPIYGNGCRLLDGGGLRVQGAGIIKIKLHRPLDGVVKTVTIKREAGKWFACFSVVVEPQPLPVSTERVGIDVGLTHFATLSDGTAIANPRHARHAARRLRVAQRKVARRRKGSERRRKAVRLLQRAYAHVRNQRADFHHKVSRALVNRYGFIAVEDLNVKGLAGGMLATSVHDAGWAGFVEKIAYKAASAGRVFLKVDPRGTSQTCLCGARVPKRLADRTHACAACGLVAGRDHVSAQLILQRAGNPPSSANVENCVSCVA